MNVSLKLGLLISAPSELFSGTRNTLEVSLPCINCQRERRTVLLAKGCNGICKPQAKCQGFCGKLDEIEIVSSDAAFRLLYRISFSYTPFIDKKYDTQSELENHRWARSYFTLRCPECGREKEFFSQVNLGRPRSFICVCGHAIAREETDPFTFDYTLMNEQ